MERVAGQARSLALRTRIGSDSHRQAVVQLIGAQRPLRNTAHGYWIAAANPQAARHAVTGSIPVSTVRDLVLMSDGASRYVDLFRAASWSQTLDLLRGSSPEKILSYVREYERRDPDGSRWPRYKSTDDATIVYVRCDTAR